MRLVSVGLLLIIGGVACSRPEAPAVSAAVGGRGGATPVSVAQVVERAMPVTLHAVGTVEASSTVDVRAQVTGQLMGVGFVEGQDVRAGDRLFTLDARPFQASLDQAEAVLARDSAQAANVEAQVGRSNELLSKGLVARADRDTLASNLAALRATLAADTAAVENARLQLQYTKITAPVSGRTGAVLVHQGALVRANDTAPLVTINQTSPINVVFAVPSRLLTRLRADQQNGALQVEASVPGAPDATSTGSLGFIDSSANPGTDTIRVKGTFANADRRLWPGQYVEVTLQLSVEDRAIVIPTAAVQASQQGQFVYVVNADQTVEARPVRVAWTDGAITVLDSGVTAADRVVTDGQLRLTNGARVSVKPAVTPAVK